MTWYHIIWRAGETQFCPVDVAAHGIGGECSKLQADELCLRDANASVEYNIEISKMSRWTCIARLLNSDEGSRLFVLPSLPSEEGGRRDRRRRHQREAHLLVRLDPHLRSTTRGRIGGRRCELDDGGTRHRGDRGEATEGRGGVFVLGTAAHRGGRAVTCSKGSTFSQKGSLDGCHPYQEVFVERVGNSR